MRLRYDALHAASLQRLDRRSTAHRLAINGLRRSRLHPTRRLQRSAPPVAVLGLDFPNPLGLAAGFDKNGEVPDAMLRLGFGFVEVGTADAEAAGRQSARRGCSGLQAPGNLNRLGFNNEGYAAAARRLAERPRRGIVGVNLGANRTPPTASPTMSRGSRASPASPTI